MRYLGKHSSTSGQSIGIILLFCMLYVGGLYLFDTVIIVVFARGWESRLFAIPYHAAFLGICLLSVLIFKKTNVAIYRGRLVVLAGVFWGLYFLRIIVDGYLAPSNLQL